MIVFGNLSHVYDCIHNYRSSTEEGSDRYSKCSCQFILFGIDVIWHNMLYRSAHRSKCGQVKERDLFRKLFQNRFPLFSYFLIIFYCSVLFIPNDLPSWSRYKSAIFYNFTHEHACSFFFSNWFRPVSLWHPLILDNIEFFADDLFSYYIQDFFWSCSQMRWVILYFSIKQIVK
jgi:hypothetical protein